MHSVEIDKDKPKDEASEVQLTPRPSAITYVAQSTLLVLYYIILASISHDLLTLAKLWDHRTRPRPFPDDQMRLRELNLGQLVYIMRGSSNPTSFKIQIQQLHKEMHEASDYL